MNGAGIGSSENARIILRWDSVVPGAMNDFFAQPGTDLLRALVRVDDQLLDYEWIPEDSRWNAVGINGCRVHLET